MGKDIKEMKKFGKVLGCGFAFLGVLLWWRGRYIYPYFFAVSALFFFLGSVFPKMLVPIEKAWMAVARVIGWIVTTLILTIMFIFVMTPLGIIRRILGIDALALKAKRTATSYWMPKDESHAARERYEKQY
ncbi:MAG: hypothetical protein JW800_05070 [Candidatus Omnitrophica bacterium]|nr:hypothetical protein [Candidatus Omnitrophota bacterium]